MERNAKYKYLIFDVDDTLLSFYSAFKKSQEDLAKRLGVECSDEFKTLDNQCGWRAWKESGLEDTRSLDVQKNYHDYYYRYIEKHYFYLAKELGTEINTDALVSAYIESVSDSKELMEADTLEVYKALAEEYKLVLATNGIASIQKMRITDFLPFTHKTYISEEVGHIKPSQQYFQAIINDLGCEPEECLMIGDSITNDIIGAKEMNIDVCYYNIAQKAKRYVLIPDYEISSISELLGLLL